MRRQFERAQQEVPEYLKEPRLNIALSLYYDAYLNLSGSRQQSMSVGTIPWVAVREYGMYNDFDDYQLYLLHKTVQSLDAAYINWNNANAKTP